MRRSHRWIGVVSCLILVVVALTAIALNHRNLWLAWTLPSTKDMQAATRQFNLDQAKAWSPDPFQAGHLMASSEKQLFESFDQGKNWQEVKLFVPAEHIVAIDYSAVNPDKLWVALRDVGIFYSEDNGIIWEEIVDLPPDPVAGEALQGLQVGANDDLYVETALGRYVYQGKTQRWDTFQRADAQQKLDVQGVIWALHTGKFWGNVGLYLYDMVALALVFLSLSGLVLARRKRRPRSAKG